MTPEESTVKFLQLNPAQQRLQIRDEIHALVTDFHMHCVDPVAHHNGDGRFKHQIKDKGPVVAVLAALILILEALGYA